MNNVAFALVHVTVLSHGIAPALVPALAAADATERAGADAEELVA